MRIAILTNAFPPLARGGAGNIANLQAKWLQRRGHEVKVWVPGPFPETESDFPVEAFTPRTSLPFAKLSNTWAPARLWFHMEDLAPNLKAVDQIRAWHPDVLLTHNLTGCGWGTPNMLQSSGLRWVHLLHDVQMFEPSGQVMYDETCNIQHATFKSGIIRYTLCVIRCYWRTFWSKRRGKALGKPDVVISPSQWLLDAHREYGLLKDCASQVLPNPVEIPAGICETELREPPKVIFLGRVSHDKGADVLVEAWRSCEPRLGNLVMVNDGPLAASIRQMNEPSIQVTGLLPHAEAMAHLYSSNLLVMPSLIMENQPTVLLEAIAAGLNVVATDVGGVRELLSGYGIIVKPGDADALAHGIKSALSATHQTQLREQILEKHNQDKVMGEMVELLGGFTDKAK
jgi:glycosyltransferase involved in cell wall biosynthesis